MKKRMILAGFVATALVLAGCGTNATQDTDAQKTDSVSEVSEDSEETDSTGETAAEQNANESSEQNVEDIEVDANTDSENVDADFSYADMAGLEFYYSSGAGGWATTMEVMEDGSFVGTYYDIDMGVTGDDYPNGTEYFCSFSGQFDTLEKVDDYTYKTTIKEIVYDNEAGTEEIQDGVKYIYTEAYGLDDPENIYFYLEGTPVDSLSEGLLSWISMDLTNFDTGEEYTELPFIAMYNENSEEGFSSYYLNEE